MSDLNPYEEGLALELKAAQERLLAACHELARFAEINTKVSDKANTLLIDGARLEDRAKKAEAERDALEAKLAECEARLSKAVEALEPMAAIAHAYDENELDDEARKFWGRHYEHENHTPHDQIELYQGRGGKRLLTLEDCMKARATLAAVSETHKLTGGKDD